LPSEIPARAENFSVSRERCPAPLRTSLTATIAAELGEAVRGGEHYQALFALGLLLFALTFAVNLTADLLIRGTRRGA
jgi:phosphate transport system permease protein